MDGYNLNAVAMLKSNQMSRNYCLKLCYYIRLRSIAHANMGIFSLIYYRYSVLILLLALPTFGAVDQPEMGAGVNVYDDWTLVGV